jgi:hypothetical protein
VPAIERRPQTGLGLLMNREYPPIPRAERGFQMLYTGALPADSVHFATGIAGRPDPSGSWKFLSF